MKYISIIYQNKNSHLLYIIKQHLGLYYLFSFPLETYPHPNCGSDVKKKLIVELEIVPSLSPIRALKENKSSTNIFLIIGLLINLMNLKINFNPFIIVRFVSHLIIG